MRKGKTPPRSPRPADARPGSSKPAGPGPDRRPAAGGGLRIYGLHAVRAALENPARRVTQLLANDEAAEALAEAIAVRRARPGRAGELAVVSRTRAELAAGLPEGAVHQGAVLDCAPLAQPDLEALIERLAAAPGAEHRPPQVILALDQVTDPRNVGAILRSAAAFGAAAVLAPKRHAPGESGPLAKAASGALDRLPYVQTGNLSQALARLQKAGFWSLGLAAEGSERLSQLAGSRKLVLVLGAEGSGLRRLTREHCDLLARLPTRAGFTQLNVAAAAAVALYALLGQDD